MFSGKPTRIITSLAVGMQIIASLFLAITVQAPQSLAREGDTQFLLEASDLIVSPAVDNPAVEEPTHEPQTDEQYESQIEGQPEEQSEAQSGFDAAVIEPASQVACEYVYDGAQTASSTLYSSDELQVQGVIYDDSYRYTWYSQRVLPGGGLSIEGRHVSDEGYVVDGQGRIVVASSDLPKGTELDVPFGSGKAVVLDTGCASGTIDIYTNF